MRPYVVVSDVRVEPHGADVLEQAFRDRLREVEGFPGFQRLEVWREERVRGSYRMVSWWDDEESFRRYMRSPEHKRSHARIPSDPARPRGTGLERFSVVAE